MQYQQVAGIHAEQKWEYTGKLRSEDIIKAALSNCRAAAIRVNAFRADASCYERETIELLESENITYYVRAENSRRLLDALVDETDWEDAMIGFRKVAVCAMEEKILGKHRRVVAYRYRQTGQLTIDDIDGYRY